MATRWARFARGWVAAAFSTFVAVLSHTLGGGAAPAALAVIVSLAFTGIVCIGLSGRTLSAWRVSASVVVSQLIFHGLFSLGASGGALVTAPDAPAGEALGGHQHAAIEFAQGVAGSAGAHGHTPGTMWLAHGIAALVTVVALLHGEAAFWSLLANARLVLRRIVARAAATMPPTMLRRSPTSGLVFLPRDRVLSFTAMRHRGPPLVQIAA
jgi:hypothetical protein